MTLHIILVGLFALLALNGFIDKANETINEKDKDWKIKLFNWTFTLLYFANFVVAINLFIYWLI